MNKFLVIFGLILALALTACGGTASEPAAAAGSGGNGAVRLSENYNAALPVQSQLAIGILQLENGDQAVDEALAAELLPLWRAVQSLSNSETAADAEVTAVLNQIQDTMSPEQIAAIAAMQITDESFQAMLADGTLSMRGAFGGNSGTAGGGEGGFMGGGPPGGGPPGGELPGGGPGGGMPGGGPGGGLGGDPSAQATRMAERMAASGGDAASFQTMAMTGAVVRLLEGKTGVVSEDPFGAGGLMGQALTAVAEATGLSVEAVQAAMNEGKTLTEIITENGGDLDAVKATLTEAMAGSDFLQDQDVEQFVTDFLEGNGFNGRSGNE